MLEQDIVFGGNAPLRVAWHLIFTFELAKRHPSMFHNQNSHGFRFILKQAPNVKDVLYFRLYQTGIYLVLLSQPRLLFIGESYFDYGRLDKRWSAFQSCNERSQMNYPSSTASNARAEF